jgi:hypothetical protein
MLQQMLDDKGLEGGNLIPEENSSQRPEDEWDLQRHEAKMDRMQCNVHEDLMTLRKYWQSSLPNAIEVTWTRMGRGDSRSGEGLGVVVWEEMCYQLSSTSIKRSRYHN